MGWNSFFAEQITDDWRDTLPVRVVSAHRGSLTVHSGEDVFDLSLENEYLPERSEDRPAVGDWLVVSREHFHIRRILDRQSVFQRGQTRNRSGYQVIAANIDVLCVVTSCNAEFNESRLERYLIVAHHCGLPTVLILTKTDLTDNVVGYIERARGLPLQEAVVPVNGMDLPSCQTLVQYLGEGQTVALVGSSGVGKSTLINTLLSEQKQHVRAIREDDAKGRHTTTQRTLLQLPQGGMIIDVPGMRELAVVGAEASIRRMYQDIVTLNQDCRFSNCTHAQEAGCAIQEAISAGLLDKRRYNNYVRLTYEAGERSQRRKNFLNSRPKKPLRDDE